jgi:hypothetical protein
MTEEERIAARATEIEEAGVARFGKETWGTMIGAIARAGATPQAVANTLQSPDALNQIQHYGKEALLKEVERGDRDAERAWNKIRATERERHYDTTSSAYRRVSPNVGSGR